MLTLEKVKNYLAEKYDIKMTGDDPVIFSESAQSGVTSRLTKWMSEHIDEVAEVLNRLEDNAGINFHDYFADEDLFVELREMRYSDPEKFYLILRSEELFLNTCLKISGDTKTIIHFNLEDLF